MKKYDKQRLFEVMGKVDPTFKPKLNENSAFNDAGEPLMTHQQYRDYSEPAEPEYDDEHNALYHHETEPSAFYIIPELEKYFNTTLYNTTFNNENYIFMTNIVRQEPIVFEKKYKCPMYVSIYNDGEFRNYVKAVTPDCNEFEEKHYEDFDIQELFDFFEPFREFILTGQDAKDKIKKLGDKYTVDNEFQYGI